MNSFHFQFIKGVKKKRKEKKRKEFICPNYITKDTWIVLFIYDWI